MAAEVGHRRPLIADPLGRSHLLRHDLTKVAALSTVLPILWLACSQPPTSAEFRVGATRAEILEAHGHPEREQVLEKTDEAIWGAIEAFWQSVPAGSSVELWAYPVEGGTVELYFVDDSVLVQGMGFEPEGAVYEGGP